MAVCGAKPGQVILTIGPFCNFPTDMRFPSFIKNIKFKRLPPHHNIGRQQDCAICTNDKNINITMQSQTGKQTASDDICPFPTKMSRQNTIEMPGIV